MKKRLKKRRFYLIRPTDGLLALSFLAADLMGPTELKGWMFAGWFAVRLFSLFASDGLRMAYATQPGIRKVRGSTTLAVFMQIIGALVAGGLYALVFHGVTPFILAVLATGLVLNIEQVFCEYLRAEGDSYSADLCGFLTAVFLFAGIMLQAPGVPVMPLCLSAIGCLITVLPAVLSAGFRPYRMNIGVLKHAPGAVIGGIAYPALALAGIYILCRLRAESTQMDDDRVAMAIRIGFFAGFVLVQTVKTPFRRSYLECRVLWPVVGLTAFLSLTAGAGILIAGKASEGLTEAVLSVCICMFAASAVISALWCNFRKTE